MKALNMITLILVIIGGINWGLVGIANYDLVAGILGGGDPSAIIPKIIYILVGLSALYQIMPLSKSMSGDMT
jgi:hypothetical protein